MSADNWAVCPKCKKEIEVKREQLLKDIKEGYGKIPSEKYLEMVAEANKLVKHEETLREDYEIGIYANENTFEVGYHARCDKCGYKYSFKHKEAL